MDFYSKRVMLSVLVAASQGIHAAISEIDLAAQENERIQQNLQDRLRYEQEQLLQSSKAPSRIEIVPPAPKNIEKGPCLNITAIHVEGVAVIAQREIHKVTQSYVNSCIDAQRIEDIMGKLTALYLSKGYAAARFYLPEQDLKTGTLKLRVEEGKLSQLQLTERAKGTMSLKTAIIGAEGKPLNLRDLEQALDQINKLQSNHATMNIYPGERIGESIAVFDNEPAKRWNGYFSYDNKGQDSTGRNQAALGVGIDNIFGLNDLLNFSYNRSLPFKANRQDSFSGSVFYAVPLGYQTLSLNASRSEYDSTLQTQFNQLHSSGETNTYTGRVDSLLYRGFNNQLRANIGLTHKDTAAFLEDVKLDVSSRKLSVLDIGLSYSDMLLAGVVNANAGYSRGLKLFNALEDAADLPAEMPKAQFEKLTYGLSYFKPFQALGQNFSFSSNFAGQYALDTLYGSEQYSIGSLYSVRGFNQSSLSGDSGYSFKNDLNLNKVYSLSNGPLIARHYIGFDYGKVDNKENSSQVGELAGVSAGTAFNFKNVALELIVTQPVLKPNFMKKPDTDFFFSTTVTF
jgi:hemolysin activation/secretion protein